MNRLRLFILAITAVSTLTAGAQELAKREVLPGRGFSLQLPEGFNATTNEEKGSLSATRERDHATFEAREVEFKGDLELLAKAATDAMSTALADFRLLKQASFELKSGLKGLKLYLEMRPSKGGPIVRQVLYFFDSRKGHKGFVTCGALEKDDLKLHPLWDKVLGSVAILE